MALSPRPATIARMTPHDQARFSKMISDFVEGCGFEKPFHLVTSDARGTASVTRYGLHGVEQVCSGPSKGNMLRMIPALTVTCISSDGGGRSAKITVVAASDDAVTSASRLVACLLGCLLGRLLSRLLSRLRLAGAVAVHQRA